MPFPLTGETVRQGGADLARVGPPAGPWFTIRDVARRFDLVDPAARAVDGIPNAVRLDDTTGTFAFDRPACLPDGFAKSPEPAATYWDFHAAVSYVPVDCDAGAVNFDRWWQRATTRLEAATAKRVARRLWFDAVHAGTGWASPSLMTSVAASGHDLTPVAGPLDITTGVGTVIQGYFDVTDTPGDAVLHLPPVLAAHVFGSGVVRVVNGRAVGPLDIPVVFGPYPHQVGLDGVDLADTGLTYVVVSGAVYSEAGDIMAASGDSSLPGVSNERRNEHGVIAERRHVTAFDPGGVYGCEVWIPATERPAP